jgi:lysophospholipase L1-like esterase
MKSRHFGVSILLAVVMVLTAIMPASSATYAPKKMAALGDSITRAYNTGSSAYTDAIANSWSTGSNTTVNSMFLRFKTGNPSLTNANLAVSGSKMADLYTQASRLDGSFDYVTILMGANDVCTSSQSTMTSVETFRTQFQAGVNMIKSKNPNAVIYVVSIPNIYQLWNLLKNNSSARFYWSLGKICQSMLANPLSTTKTDVARRAAVSYRNQEFNWELRAVCAATPQCYYDNDLIYNTAFTKSDISTRDYFHPSLAGQTKLALNAWNAWLSAP